MNILTNLIKTVKIDTFLHQKEASQANKMSAYYGFHSKIYDATRWTFLFGRQQLIRLLPIKKADTVIIEIGCGTGYNLQYLNKLNPKAPLIGVDISSDMLLKASKKLQNTTQITLINALYDERTLLKHTNTEGVAIQPGIALFSYCLTMVNPNWQQLILQAQKDLSAQGYIAVVDFHDSSSSLFKKWMSKNHVRMEGQLLPFLNDNFDTVQQIVKPAYGGFWHYVIYIGKKKF